MTEQGAHVCPDCFGDGKQLGQGSKVEWRLRELERQYVDAGEMADDARWLIHELRACREALIGILSVCQDADENDELANRIKHQANRALGFYAELTNGD